MADTSLWGDVVANQGTLGEISHGDLGPAAAVEDMARRVLASAPSRGRITFLALPDAANGACR